jgi:hypothetical protein
MLNRIRFFRERGWEEISPEDYAELWRCHGGSVATHPAFVKRLSGLAEIPVRYLGWRCDGVLVAAIPVWGRHLALSMTALKAFGKKRFFDLGSAEIIFPVVSGAEKIPLRHAGRNISVRHATDFAGLKQEKETLAFLKKPDAFSAKFRKNQRRNLRQFEEAGGFSRPVSDFSPKELADIYLDLFQRRWGEPAAGAGRMAEVFALLCDWMRGFVIFLNDAPVAAQVLYQVESQQWVSVEYINGGVDPQARDFSPGNVVTYLNTDAAREEAQALGKTLRYSFGRYSPGRTDSVYKSHWCSFEPVFRV